MWTATAPRAPQRECGPIGALNSEWKHLRDLPLPTAWVEDFAEMACLGDITDALAQCNAEQAGPLLRALLTRASHEELAGRVALQAMLGKVARLSRTARGRGHEDSASIAIAAMWGAIRHWPSHRPGSVPGNLALEALRLIPPAEPSTAPLEDDEAGALTPLGHRCLEESATRDELVTILQWGLDHEVISRQDTRLLALMHLRDDDDQISLKEAADLIGASYAATRQRHARAVRALAAAVRERMKTPAA